MDALTPEAIDDRILAYCQRHGIKPKRALTTWIARRHPELIKLRMLHMLVVQGRQDEIPPVLLEPGELKPLTARQRYLRANARRAEWRSVYPEIP